MVVNVRVIFNLLTSHSLLPSLLLPSPTGLYARLWPRRALLRRTISLCLSQYAWGSAPDDQCFVASGVHGVNELLEVRTMEEESYI